MTNKLKRLEQILNVQFEVHDYKKEQPNYYKTYGDAISDLSITGCVIDINELLPIVNKLYRLRLTNCTIDSLAGFSQLPRLTELTFDNVTILRGKKTIHPIFESIPFRDWNLHVYLANMHLQFPAELLALTGHLDHLFLTNCTISNFYEINLFPNLYDLRLTNVVIQLNEEDIVHKSLPDRNFIRICLEEMQLENLDVFVPISENVSHIRIEHSTINSIQNIHLFRMLDMFEIDSETKIQDTSFTTNSSSDFHISECIVGKVGRYEFIPEETLSFDLQQLGSIAQYVKGLNFKGSLVHKTPTLTYFTQLDTLEFDKGCVSLSDFLPVANQIKTLIFDQCKVEQYDCITAFTQLETIHTSSYHEHKMLGDLKVLLPLKNQLKELDLFEEDIQHLELLKEFTELETVKLRSIDSIEVAQNVLTLPKLKKLSWSFYLETELEAKPNESVVIDVSGLKSIRDLELNCDIPIRGIETLTELERLELRAPCSINQIHQLKKLKFLNLTLEKGMDVNQISTMESLKILILSADEDQEIHTLEQFPNLEQLELETGFNVHVGKLEKLKVLVPGQIDLQTTTLLDNLPNLEKLNLYYGNNSVIKQLDKLTKLKWLDLSENEIENIEGLEKFKHLEYLNLYNNKISDVRILNQLPNLKLVNLAGNELDDDEFRAQLNNPKIAYFFYPPYSPFSIRVDRMNEV